MKKRCSLILVALLAVTFCFFATSCGDKAKDKKLKYFRTEQFTEETFYSAIRKYGEKIDSSKYTLTDNQAKAAYNNITVKMLITSEMYDSAPNDIRLDSLWVAMYEDIFSNDNSYTVESLFKTVKEKCVHSYGSSIFLITSTSKYMAKNDSIVNLCKNNGSEVFATLKNKDFELFIEDIIDLFIDTDTFGKNMGIAYYHSSSAGYVPLAMEATFWYSPTWKSEGNGFCFENSTTYQDLVKCIKEQLKDPDSYRSNGNIEFYSFSEGFVSEGFYNMFFIVVRVPFRAKNGFGGYGTDVAWLFYDWNTRAFTWVGSSKPSIAMNSYPFKTESVS